MTVMHFSARMALTTPSEGKGDHPQSIVSTILPSLPPAAKRA